MSQAKSQHKKEQVNSATTNATTNGMDDFFNPANDANDTTGKKGKNNGAEILTVKQACQKLGIRKRTLYARISDGTYKTYAGRDNKIRIIFTSEGPKVASHAARVVQAVATASSKEVGQTIHTTSARKEVDNVTNQQLVDLIEKLTLQLSSASTRIGYLEAQVTNYQDQVKLLPDLTEKAAQMTSLKEENAELRKKFAALDAELKEAHEPWWRKMFKTT